MVLVLGVGGTAVVADNARPGDALFGVDQTVENMRLKLAGDERENELRIKFAEERVAELEDLADDEDEDTTVVDESTEAGGEEENGQKADLSEEEQGEVNLGIEAALALLGGLEETEGDNPELKAVLGKLNVYLSSLPENAEVKISENQIKIEFESEDGEETKIKQNEESGKTKVEIKTEEGKIKLEVESGVVKIKTEVEDDEDKEENDADEDSDNKDDDEDSDEDSDDEDDSDSGKDDSSDDEDEGPSDDSDDSNSGSDSGRD